VFLWENNPVPPAAFAVLFGFLFETPWITLAVAAGAASLPIIIHLLNRKRFRVVTWAAMRFLLAAQRRNTRRMRLEQLLLLAVRTLLLLLLVLAMASVMPWAEELWFRIFPDPAVRAATGSPRTHKVLVLDGSFSMALKVGDTSCFERARSLAGQLVQESPAGDGFSVLLMATPPRPVVPEPSDDAHKVADEIHALRLPHGNADLVGTLQAVEDMLRRSPRKFETHEVYFLTDLQRSTWTAQQNGDPGALLQRIQARARMIFVDVGHEGASNAAVTDLSLGVPFVTTGAVTMVTATIHNYGAEPRKKARVELLIGKARATANDPAFALHGAGQVLVDLLPGQNIVTFPYRFRTPGDYAVQARLDNDVLDLDDARTVILTVKDHVPVMLANGKPAAELYDQATEWLKDALNPFLAGLVPRDIAARPKVVSQAQFSDAALGDLTPYDCVFLCDMPQLDAAEVRRLETHLHRGGGVVFCLGPRVDLEAYNRLVYRNGDGILPARLIGRQSAPPKSYFNLFAGSDDKDYKNPPLNAFTDIRDRETLRSARFREYVQVELAPGGRARKVLSFMPEASTASASNQERGNTPPLPAGDPALVEWSRHRGRVLLFTSTVNMDWTTWPVSPSFPALMQELLHFAVAGRLREQGAVVGDVLEEYLQPAAAGLAFTLHTPDGQIENGRTQPQAEVGVLRWTDTDISGVYRATIGHDPREYLFAVNVPTAAESQQACESDLARTNPTELQAAYPGWEFQLVTDLHQVVHSGGPASAAPEEQLLNVKPGQGMGTVLARWLLLAMLGLLIVEVVLAWRFGHYSAVAGVSDTPPAPSRAVPIIIAALAGSLLLVLAGVLVHAAWTGDFLGFLPEAARAAVEARLDIPPPAAGEGTRWHLEFMPYLWDAAADPWLAGTLAVGLAVLVVAIYLREGRTAGGPYKLLLAGLRLFLILLALTVLLPQLRLAIEREGWPDLAIVLDDSRSMSTTDHYQDPAVQEMAQQLGQESGLSSPQRLQLAQALLTQKKAAWLESLLTKQRVKLHLYHCSSRAARIASVAEPQELQAAALAVGGLRAEGESTQLGRAVRHVLNDFRGSALSAMIILSDGLTTEGEDLAGVARYAAQVGVPLFLVGIGDDHEVRDLKLHDLQVEDSVYVNDRLVFEARLTGQGYTDQRVVTVTLYEKDPEGNLKELDYTRVQLDPEGKPVKFSLKHQPTEPGEKTYVVRVPVQADEIKQADNNRLERTVFVREAKLIRVLYVDGYARYDYRFIKNLLERESNREKRNKTMDLKVLLLEADSEYASEDKSALADFPTKEELNSYDVVLWGDVDPKDRKIGESNLRHLADFVKERGGGFLMIAGPRYSPQAYKDSPLRDVLPVQVTGPEKGTVPLRREGQSPFPGGFSEDERLAAFRPELTPIGRSHPIFRFSPDEASNKAIWSHLAELQWWAEGFRIQRAAEVLLVHPQRPDPESGRAGAGGAGGFPLFVQQFVGAGRSMFLGFDETWRWRLREDEMRFNQFWIQTIRYLARSRLGRVLLRVDRQTPYRRGEPIKLTVRFPDDAPPPDANTRVEVIATHTPLRRDSGGEGPAAEIEKETLRLAKLEGSRATYEAVLTRTPEGEYRFRLSTPLVPDPKPQAECRVLPPPGELDQLRMNQPDMKRAALETHGKFYTLADAEHLIEDLPPGTRITLHAPQPPRLLWNHFSVFTLALGLLGTEWVLRKRKHLL
jgi:hypothetical protein